jgi:hypothetical protein
VGCASGMQVHACSRPQDTWNSSGVHPKHLRFQWTEDTRSVHVNKDSTTPITIFLLLFVEVIQLLVAKPNKYYNQYLDILDNGRNSWPPAVTEQMYIF